jgi:hypothetical protein
VKSENFFKCESSRKLLKTTFDRYREEEIQIFSNAVDPLSGESKVGEGAIK